nr:GntR family transcriptional regulator [Micromonospora sp. DSM 115978]
MATRNRWSPVAPFDLPPLDPTVGALWLQIAAAVRAAVESGAVRQGARLPSTSQIGRRYGTTRYTALKAMKALADEGVIRWVRDEGFFSRGGQ